MIIIMEQTPSWKDGSKNSVFIRNSNSGFQEENNVGGLFLQSLEFALKQRLPRRVIQFKAA